MLSHSNLYDRCTQAERFIIRTTDWTTSCCREKLRPLYILEVVGFSVFSDVPDLAVSAVASQVSSFLSDRNDAYGFDTAWHLSFSETAPADNQFRDCTALL